jgi:hypothetical protein
MTDLFGQAAPPASPSAARGGKKAKRTSATSSPLGLASSASAALQQSLESKLQAALPTGGLTMFIRGWKPKVTPLGRRYCQLAASAHPIDGRDCGLWVTPQSFDATNDGKPRPLRYKGDAPSEAGNTRSPDKSGSYRGDLKDWAGVVAGVPGLWPTPRAMDGEKGVMTPEGHAKNRARYKNGMDLPTAMAMCLYPTPQSRDHFPAHSAAYIAEKKALGHGMANLNDVVAHLWTTPSSRDWKDTPGMVAERQDGKSRNDQLPRQVFGVVASGLPALTVGRGSLNPAFPCWLMGFSTAALSSMHLAMQSYRRLGRRL